MGLHSLLCDSTCRYQYPEMKRYNTRTHLANIIPKTHVRKHARFGL